MQPRLHRFTHNIQGMEPPPRFTCPFRYTPHPLCLAAAQEVQRHVRACHAWHDELARGKMLGVLVVDDGKGGRGFLAAFSGTLAGKVDHSYFVPPVYDLLQQEGVFRTGEREITAINHRIDSLENEPQHLHAERQLEDLQQQAAHEVQRHKSLMEQAKRDRDRRRQEGDLTPEQEQLLVRQSQHLKAEHRRLKQGWKQRLQQLADQLTAHRREVDALKHRRKAMSEALQRRIFELFVVNNARGERSGLLEIFEHDSRRLPPAGAGECCAPRLLQHAFTTGLRPLCMAEFWVGGDNAATGEVRRDGHFYPACDSKCRPILQFMLQGLDVDPERDGEAGHMAILYRDEWLVAVDKPAGLLSVPGRTTARSAWSLLSAQLEVPFLRAVHRLDMDTSGVLVFALSPQVHKLLQRQFTACAVTKVYEALLHGPVPHDEGVVDLPLAPDHDNRPLQRVDAAHGKRAVTRYKVLARGDGTTRMAFLPLTGRTHQLRVHAASSSGLDAPIMGDSLYGNRGDASSPRLCLHARSLTIVHPVTRRPLTITAPVPF